jgi:hypothetical protein
MEKIDYKLVIHTLKLIKVRREEKTRTKINLAERKSH